MMFTTNLSLCIVQPGVGRTQLKGLVKYYLRTQVMASSFFQRYKSHTPIPKGPYVVGCTDIMVGRTKEGTLMRLYYPTNVTDPMSIMDKWTPWYLGDEYTKGLASFIAPSISSLFTMLFNWQMRGVLTPAIWEEPMMEKKFPVVVFSHGLSANRSIYSTVCTELSSHGFVVAAVEHRDTSACASFTLNEDGSKEHILFRSLQPNEKEYDLRNQQIKIRVQESIRALDVLEKLDQGKITNELPSKFDLQQLCGRLDLTMPIMSGHSFGGGTTICTLSKDKRFKVGVALDPWMFPLKDEVDEICSALTQPLLCISTEAFQNEVNLKAMSKLNDETTTFVTIKGTVHQNQCDTPFLVGPIGRVFAGASSPLDPGTAMDINNRLMINFICKHLGMNFDLQEQIKSFLSRSPSIIYGLYGGVQRELKSKL